jgi:hypothetical protein
MTAFFDTVCERLVNNLAQEGVPFFAAYAKLRDAINRQYPEDGDTRREQRLAGAHDFVVEIYRKNGRMNGSSFFVEEDAASSRPHTNGHDTHHTNGHASTPENPPGAPPPENQRAIERHASMMLAVMNGQYAVAAEGGKVWVIKSRPDPNYAGRHVLDRFTFADFSKLYMNEWIAVVTDGKIENKSLPGWWLHHRDRRQYRSGIILDPTGTPDGYYNLWRGFACKPIPGSWHKLKNHIHEIICAGNETLSEYLLSWMARLFQQPSLPGEVAIVLKGEEGTGKGILCRAVLDILGQHGLHITSSGHLVGRFNAHLRDCIALFADEAFFAGDRQHVGVLKALITEPSIAIEGKGRDVVVVKNRLHVMMSSNEDRVVPAGRAARRYAVFEVSEARLNDFSYFKDIQAELDAGGREAMLHELLNRDISDFEVRDIPVTAGLREQKALSLDSLGQWWQAVLSRGFVYKSKYGTPWFGEWQEFYTTELLFQSYTQFCAAARPRDVKVRQELGVFMSKLHTRVHGPEPGPEHAGDPVGEIDSIDTDRNMPRSLDDIAIMRSKIRAWGYRVGTIDEATARFGKVCGVLSP